MLRPAANAVLVVLLATRCATAPSTSSPAPYPHAVVAADHPLASQAGAEMLRRGGNAVDAAVATAFALSVVRPESCGIGGGGFMLISLPSVGEQIGATVALDYREAAPAAVTAEIFATDADPLAGVRGGRAAAVPGSVAGLLHALQRYGKLSRQIVLQPAIRLARNGFVADGHQLRAARDLVPQFAEHPEWRERFRFVWERYLHEGKLQVGDTISVPEQARLLQRIADHGTNGFYHGPVATAIVQALAADRGLLTAGDLECYRPIERAPLAIRSGDRLFLTMPPPSSGGIALAQTIGILDRRNDWPHEASDWNGASLHLFIEALKHAFADRATWLADPAFHANPLEQLLAVDYLAARAAQIDPSRTLAPEAYGSRPVPSDDQGTSHISVVDTQGGAVACTETVNQYFGSLLAVPEYGLVLNDEMDDFTPARGRANQFALTQAEANLPGPGKRPLSSMSPTIVRGADGQIEAVAGGSSGPRIISATLEVLVRALWFADDAERAVTAPRFHHQWQPDLLQLEPAFREGPGAAWVHELERRGHKLGEREISGYVQLIRRAKAGQGWDAASDPRKGGRPAGW